MIRIATAIILMVASPLLADEKEFFFRKGDRVVFLGDSITEQYQYSTYVELYLTTRFPDWKLEFLNAGIGGDTANGGAGRFQAHVLYDKPTAITINFGMNDGGYRKFDANANKTYVEKTEAMLVAAKKSGVRVALLSPNAVDRRRSPAWTDFKVYVETQKQFYAPLKDLAATHGVSFADQYAMTRAALERMEADKADGVVPYYDGFHTSPPGGLLMAHAILKGLNAPAEVSNVIIDAKMKKTASSRCKVDGLDVTDEVVSFERTDDSLPMPIQNDWVSILPYVNDLKDLNHYGLQVKGLKQGIWEVFIDGKSILKSSAEDLDKGINLGNVRTGSVYDHAQKVFAAINAKNTLVAARFHQVMRYNAPDWLADVARERKPGEVKKRLETILAKQAEIHQLSRPTAHKFEVKFSK